MRIRFGVLYRVNDLLLSLGPWSFPVMAWLQTDIGFGRRKIPSYHSHRYDLTFTDVNALRPREGFAVRLSSTMSVPSSAISATTQFAIR